MSSTGALVRAKLEADAAVVALVGSKIFPGMAPDDTVAPWIVYLVVSDVPELSFTGTADTTMRAARVQFDCYAQTYDMAQSIAAAVDAVVSAMTSPQLSAFREVTRDSYDNEAKLHRASMDVTIWR